MSEKTVQQTNVSSDNVKQQVKNSGKQQASVKTEAKKQPEVKNNNVNTPKQMKDSIHSKHDGLTSANFFDAMLDGERDASISVTGSGPTFDDFENAEKAREEIISAKIERSEKINKKEKEEEVEENTKEKENTPEESNEAVEKKEEVVEEKQEEHIEEEEKKKFDNIKKLKVYFGKEEYELPASLEIPVKVDGKVERYQLQDLINNFSGKVSWDRKFSELDRDRKKFLSERDNLIGHLNNMKTHLNSDRPENALLYLVDLLGGDRYTFIKGLRDSLAPEILRYYSMDDNERLAYDNEQRALALEERLRRYEEEKQRLQRANAVTVAKENAKRLYSISDEEYLEAEEYLREKTGGNEVSPELVVKYIKAYNALERVENIAASVSPKLLQNQDLIVEVSKYVSEHGFTDEEIYEIFRDLLGIKKVEKVISEKEKETVSTKTINEKDEAYIKSWDELDY